jgi:hypothetical protein
MRRPPRSPKRRSIGSASSMSSRRRSTAHPPDQRQQQRRLRFKPIAEVLATWAEGTAPKLSRKSELEAAFRYMLARWTALTRCLEDGRLGLDNNPAERALRGVAMTRSLCPLPQVSVKIRSWFPCTMRHGRPVRPIAAPPVPVAGRRHGFGEERLGQPARRGGCRP